VSTEFSTKTSFPGVAPIDLKVWRAYGWRNLTVWRACPAFRLLVECSDSWHVDALDSKVAEAPK
jgi:hypothetical protein